MTEKLTLGEFARRCGVNPKTIASRLGRDRLSGRFRELPGDRIGGIWRLTIDRWEQFAPLRETGRPRSR